MSKVILFDIDGTLVLTGGAGGRAMARAFEALFSIPNAFQTIPFAGRTDSSILTDALSAHGVDSGADSFERFRQRYLEELGVELLSGSAHQTVLPGVRSLLEVLERRDDAYVALLTGNYEDGARMKLEHFDLWRYFACGAFGDNASERNGLFPTSMAAIRACGGPAVSPDDVTVVGDTPLDVACAAAAGARSLAVATGGFDAHTLRAAGADIVMEDLGDTTAVLRAIGLEG